VVTAADLHRYSYRAPSGLDAGRLLLQTSGGRTDRGPATHPRFFTGFLTRAQLAATGLPVLADLARTDFRRAGQPLDGTLRGFRDPIVTSGGDRPRFEAFSGCCGGYGRLDVLDAALDGEVVAHGTTNVDVNPPLYAALTRVGGGDPLRLSVGPDELTMSTLDGSAVEKKVPLPDRWLRGLAEVPAAAAGFDPRAELTAAVATAFLGRLPTGAARQVRWLVPVGRALRSTMSPVPGAVCLAAPSRLEALSPRLVAARALGAEPIDGGFEVRSGDRTYLVHRRTDGGWGCTCPWWAEHRGGRGPCKHVLAATRETATRETATREAG
jgi:hypothetical protein